MVVYIGAKSLTVLALCDLKWPSLCKVGVFCLFFSAVTFDVYWSVKEIKANASKAKKRLKYLTVICKDIHICGK